MRSPMQLLFLCLTVSLCSLGCSTNEHEYFAKSTVPVTGKVTVDGVAPGSPIVIKCHPEGGLDTEHPSVTQALTTPEGTFNLSTYEEGDGIPAGKYQVTFFWGKFNPISGSYGGPDKLKNRYAKPDKTPITLEVTGNEPIDMGVIALTTK
ncbi:carboxypeptidase regulatory-like domain-containing protein [Bremerella cremea]|uniref:Carboxypeptidase regulatory-like domain-containing protein n=1 Tax=Bremerella cremea TaxID=1031537 RepID=A0A368KQS8_9BACT|nr:carboxypeptidase regulatory-like domain-containing protein [Bremerella cremea]RCS44639.1 carboxypeptidase regulatory-like domain-containing protein [Bremerella cremea]